MNPFDLLGVRPDATTAELKVTWKKLAQQHHPDKGGDAAKFDELRKAYHKAIQIAKRPRNCVVCRGDGKTRYTVGLNSLMIRCKACNGTGVANALPESEV